MIQVKNLTNQFGAHTVHHRLNLEVYEGEILGLIGGSGTGKSVLLRTLLGLHTPTQGRISMMGVSLPDGLATLRLLWGVQFQSGALFSALTVAENIALPLKEFFHLAPETIAQITALKLKLVGLLEEDGLKYPSQLSGGMVKRVALARALACDPPLLFLDEPTSGLDPIAADAYDRLLYQLRAALNLTIVMITHDLTSLNFLTDRVAVLYNKTVLVQPLQQLIHHKNPWIQQYFSGLRGQVVER
jgi:phospholipid/cholesterol/gamma-HCH transport system ATP-binding protein